MELPKISVVIPSYNKVKFISQTLDSIVTQDYSNLEVIIQDGGSTDGTLEIIKKYVKKYPTVFKYESKKDKGQLDAINTGFEKSSGEILTFINADDEYCPGTLNEIAKAYIENPGSLWFAGRGTVINAKGREIAKFATLYKNFLLSLNLRFFLLTTNYLMQPSVFLRRKAYVSFGPFRGTPDFVMEYDLWLRLSQGTMPVVINSCLSRFRLEPSTKSESMTKQLLKEDEKIINKYSSNKLILFLHKLNNLFRIAVGKLYE